MEETGSSTRAPGLFLIELAGLGPSLSSRLKPRFARESGPGAIDDAINQLSVATERQPVGTPSPELFDRWWLELVGSRIPVGERRIGIADDLLNGFISPQFVRESTTTGRKWWKLFGKSTAGGFSKVRGRIYRNPQFMQNYHRLSVVRGREKLLGREPKTKLALNRRPGASRRRGVPRPSLALLIYVSATHRRVLPHPAASADAALKGQAAIRSPRSPGQCRCRRGLLSRVT